MQSRERPRLSRLRQTLQVLGDESRQLLDVCLEREPLLKGTLYTMRRRCGKAACACATGALHATRVLSWSEQGRTRLRTLSAAETAALAPLVARYQRVRRARARLVQLHRRMLGLIDRLEAARRRTG